MKRICLPLFTAVLMKKEGHFMNLKQKGEWLKQEQQN